MKAELTEHLGYDKHEATGRGSGDSRNGTTPKTIKTEVGPVRIDQPRDRAGTFFLPCCARPAPPRGPG
ncbi:transposase [Schaalia sp. ZJ405]|uniref:transposase n=1 Tax=Schaalia sp. ZJ405 TaxID=2709403 RepID=UPI0013EE13D5|nr:transposase [Schaalia sp. ZJ405]QPK81271.1 transposase [Schaalia sp. ZJ405]